MVLKLGKERPKATDLLTLGQIRHFIPTKPSYATIYRWCTEGLRGICLDYEEHGAWFYTTLANYERFMRRVSEKRR